MYQITRNSTIRFINSNRPAGTVYVDWDAVGDLTQIPTGDLIGIHAFGLQNFGKFHRITFGVTIAVVDDPNLFRIADYVKVYQELMQPEKDFDLLDPTTGAPIAKALFVDGVAVHPINRFETRVAQSVQASALVTLTT